VKNEIATIGGADSASGSLTDRHGGTIESDSLGGGHTRGARGSKWSPDSTNFAVAPFWLTNWDQFGDEIGAAVRLSVLRRVQLENTGMRKGIGLL
jgi:hypothetical protein